MFMRIYTTPETYWLENPEALKAHKMPAPPVCLNLKNCEFYPDTLNFATKTQDNQISDLKVGELQDEIKKFGEQKQ